MEDLSYFIRITGIYLDNGHVEEDDEGVRGEDYDEGVHGEEVDEAVHGDVVRGGGEARDEAGAVKVKVRKRKVVNFYCYTSKRLQLLDTASTFEMINNS